VVDAFQTDPENELKQVDMGEKADMLEHLKNPQLNEVATS
jgi:hypothetical protein